MDRTWGNEKQEKAKIEALRKAINVGREAVDKLEGEKAKAEKKLDEVQQS